MPRDLGGSNAFDNCIPLCFDCHAEVQNYNARHPRGTKYTPKELKERRDLWYREARSTRVARPLAEDRKTLRDFMQILPSNGSIEFLRNRDFAGWSFDWEFLRDLENFVYTRNGPDHEFIDPELERLRTALLRAGKALLSLLALETFPVGSKDRQSVPEEWEIEQAERFRRVVHQIHTGADRVCEAYDNLVRKARQKLAT